MKLDGFGRGLSHWPQLADKQKPQRDSPFYEERASEDEASREASRLSRLSRLLRRRHLRRRYPLEYPSAVEIELSVSTVLSVPRLKRGGNRVTNAQSRSRLRDFVGVVKGWKFTLKMLL